jgi:hypothetical protein
MIKRLRLTEKVVERIQRETEESNDIFFLTVPGKTSNATVFIHEGNILLITMSNPSASVFFKKGRRSDLRETLSGFLGSQARILSAPDYDEFLDGCKDLDMVAGTHSYSFFVNPVNRKNLEEEMT